MTWLQRVGHIPGKRAGMAGSEHHQCHQQRGWGTKILSKLASWLGGGTCSPVSPEHPALPARACRGTTKPLCHRRWGACATAPAVDGLSSLRTEGRRHGGCGPARGAGWSAGGRRSPPAPRPVKRAVPAPRGFAPSFPAAPHGVCPTSQWPREMFPPPCPQPHGIIHLSLSSKTLTNRLYTDDAQQRLHTGEEPPECNKYEEISHRTQLSCHMSDLSQDRNPMLAINLEEPSAFIHH
ncbi:uncharacterized protein [Physeter macrocephalus]|uniref:Uncharacterized protein n=1 Tax=Physeter macrocephalus TaxID=9755 RepID=A0A9W2WD52_PHYMC|nr:uncharacterized protein LOC112062620 [Physeter catodon]